MTFIQILESASKSFKVGIFRIFSQVFRDSRHVFACFQVDFLVIETNSHRCFCITLPAFGGANLTTKPVNKTFPAAGVGSSQ